MPQPADRSSGVSLVTDYGALDNALKVRAKKVSEGKLEPIKK